MAALAIDSNSYAECTDVLHNNTSPTATRMHSIATTVLRSSDSRLDIIDDTADHIDIQLINEHDEYTVDELIDILKNSNLSVQYIPTVKKLSDMIKELQYEYDTIHDQLIAVNAQYNDTIQHINRNNQVELDQLQAKQNKLQHEMAQHTTQLDQLKHELMVAKSTAAHHQSQYHTTNNELIIQRKKYQSLIQRNTQLQSDYISINSRLQHFQSNDNLSMNTNNTHSAACKPINRHTYRRSRSTVQLSNHTAPVWCNTNQLRPDITTQRNIDLHASINYTESCINKAMKSGRLDDTDNTLQYVMQNTIDHPHHGINQSNNKQCGAKSSPTGNKHDVLAKFVVNSTSIWKNAIYMLQHNRTSSKYSHSNSMQLNNHTAFPTTIIKQSTKSSTSHKPSAADSSSYQHDVFPTLYSSSPYDLLAQGLPTSKPMVYRPYLQHVSFDIQHKRFSSRYRPVVPVRMHLLEKKLAKQKQLLYTRQRKFIDKLHEKYKLQHTQKLTSDSNHQNNGGQQLLPPPPSTRTTVKSSQTHKPNKQPFRPSSAKPNDTTQTVIYRQPIRPNTSQPASNRRSSTMINNTSSVANTVQTKSNHTVDRSSNMVQCGQSADTFPPVVVPTQNQLDNIDHPTSNVPGDEYDSVNGSVMDDTTTQSIEYRLGSSICGLCELTGGVRYCSICELCCCIDNGCDTILHTPDTMNQHNRVHIRE